jgi:hypothetical protein
MSELHVASPRVCNTQQATPHHATAHATSAQQQTHKSPSLLELARNRLRNNHATQDFKGMQQQLAKQPPAVASVAEMDRLIRLVAERYACPADEEVLIRRTALEHRDEALECFRAMTAERFQDLNKKGYAP